MVSPMVSQVLMESSNSVLQLLVWLLALLLGAIDNSRGLNLESADFARA